MEHIKLEKIKDKSKNLQSLKLFRIAKNKVTMALNIKKRDFVNNEFTESFKSNTLWSTVNKLTGYKAKPFSEITSLILKDNTETTDKTTLFFIFNTLANSFIVFKMESSTEPDPQGRVNEVEE